MTPPPSSDLGVDTRVKPRWASGGELVHDEALLALLVRIKEPLAQALSGRAMPASVPDAKAALGALVEAAQELAEQRGRDALVPYSSDIITAALLVVYRTPEADRRGLAAIVHDGLEGYREGASESTVAASSWLHLGLLSGRLEGDAGKDVARLEERLAGAPDGFTDYNIACVTSIAMLGNPPHARPEELARKVRSHLRKSASSIHWRRYDPDLEPARAMARVQPERQHAWSVTGITG